MKELEIKKEEIRSSIINRENFYLGTFGIFANSKKPLREPDYISYTRDYEISSEYWYGTDKGGEYVIRRSGHWSIYIGDEDWCSGYHFIRSCFWILKTKKNNEITGKCYFSDFKNQEE